MSTPTYLKKGDKIAVLCPASYISVDLSPAYAILKSWGLEVVVYASVVSQEHQFAGNDDLRAEDLQKALDDPEIKAIIAGRGGYGCVRIIDSINFEIFCKNPKWIVGFSDITVLHSHIQNNYQIPTIHGQMVKSFLDGTPESLETLRKALFGEGNDLSYISNSELPNREGEATGILTGGNLAILQSIISSDSDIDYTNKILFIEDVGESYYNIDRMLWTLKRAKKLENLRGLIVGGFTDLKDSDPSFGQNIEGIIMDKVAEYNYPVAFGCPAGHIENNLAIVLGREIILKTEKNNVDIQYI
ncbi:S66 peptidase family protein [Sphingobacterium rhinopitheci]|uniref:S66 peptidase family protein n=1 Tax=Sphingobacterium rhinopitheci TaxID=2781960 RepID=UPI001F51AD5B|nr:LD-carboxypeptidase [Sphingobacterium rhinopitheci]MCI0920862.1 LD-carboxypeptidase [Sphingobacterium rhinopitheci]